MPITILNNIKDNTRSGIKQNSSFPMFGITLAPRRYIIVVNMKSENIMIYFLYFLQQGAVLVACNKAGCVTS